MNYKKYKCFLAAAMLTAGLCLTACGASTNEAVETTEEKVAVVDETAEENTKDSEETSEETAAADENKTESSEENQEDVKEEKVATTMYTTESITMHKEASKSSEDLGVVAIGSTVQAYDESGDYIKVSVDGKEGYVLKIYLTDDKAVADKALEDSKAAASQTKSDDKSSKKKDKDKKTECLDDGLLN